MPSSSSAARPGCVQEEVHGEPGADPCSEAQEEVLQAVQVPPVDDEHVVHHVALDDPRDVVDLAHDRWPKAGQSHLRRAGAGVGAMKPRMR